MSPSMQRAALKWSPWLVGAAPVIAALVGRTLAPAFGPAQSHAAEPVSADASLAALDPLPEARTLATAFAAQALAQEMGPSPFARLVAAPAPVNEAPPVVVENETSREWLVTSILEDKRGGGAIAVINGKVRRAGETVAPGWVVAAIDASGGAVTLNGPGGATATVRTTKRR